MAAATEEFLTKCRRLLLWSPACINVRRPKEGEASAAGATSGAGSTTTAPSSSSSSSKLISVGSRIEGILEIDISDWCDVLDESFLVEVTRDCRQICLTMAHVDGVSLHPGLLGWIIKYISPKLLELTVQDCRGLTWTNHVKRILEAAGAVETINLQRNPWVDDFVVDQISTKFAKSLRAIDLENTKVTDNALHNLGKRCQNVRNVTLNCCPKVTDTGLEHLCKKVHLSNINICHNLNITDDGIEKLISASNQLYSVRLTNCPKLTDAAMEAMYEAIAAWGKRRNTKSLTLKILELRDNPLITFQALVFLSTAVPNLVTLDLRDCTNIDLSQGMHEMERMRYIENIYLGPSNHPLHADAFLQSMLFHAANLKTLHLVGIGNMDDDDLAELISGTLLLTDLYIEGMDLGTHAVEAICSNIPNITKLVIIGSKILGDMELRCVASICLFLVELTVSSCPLVGDAAFSRCVGLKRLKRLAVGRCHPKAMVGGFLGFLTTCPLELLSLDGLNFKPSSYLKLLSPTTRNALEDIRLLNFKAFDVDDVTFLLKNFINCSSLDLTGSARGELLGVLPALRHTHPFLSYVNDGEFVGYSESVISRGRHVRFRHMQKLLRRYYAARKIQKVRRGFVKWRLDMLERQRLAREAYRIMCVAKIQSIFRMCLSRKRVAVQLHAGRRIVRGARRFLICRFHRKIVKAKNHYQARLKRNLIALLQRHKVLSQSILSQKTERLFPRLRFLSRKKTYTYFKEEENNVREENLYRKSLVLWEGHLLQLKLNKWRSLIGETKSKRKKLAKLFSVVAALETQNSYRQLANFAMAFHFHKFRRLVQVWICFADDLIRSRNADLLVPRAESHFKHTFFQRVVRKCFRAIIYFIETKRIKALAIVKAQEGRVRWLRFNGLRYTFEERMRMQRIKKNRTTALAGYFTYYAKMTLQNRLPVNNWFENHLREVKSKVIIWWADYKVDYFFHNMMYNCTRFKYWREMEYLADKLRTRIYGKEYFAKWVWFKLNNQSLGDTLYRRYCLAIARKCFASLLQNIKDGREYKEMVKTQLAEAASRYADAEEDPAVAAARVMEILVRGARILQAVIRGIAGRKVASAWRVRVFYATQVLQNFARRGLALLKCKMLRRRRQLGWKKLEDEERALMRGADVESKYYEICFAAALYIQRMYRGYRGRIKAKIDAYAITRERGQIYYDENAKIRENLEAARAASEMRERTRGRSAALIQKRVRGMLARIRFIQVKMHARKTACTIKVQTYYRRRLGMLLLQSMKRDKFYRLRYESARRQRGFLLRMIGLKKRKQQRLFAPALDALGIDPISFNYRINELIEETKADFKEMLKVMVREIGLYRRFGFGSIMHKLERDADKKKLLADDGVGLEVRDACRIIQDGHPYKGQTGVIARMDSSMPGIPLYEIKLDSFDRQTFVHMTSDPLATYMLPQPLNEIENVPKIDGFVQNFVLYGVNEGDPMFSRRNITNAWVIQRAYRMHRSRRIVARRRFELWLQSCDRQWAFFNHLADTNTLTMQSNFFLSALGVKPVKPVFYDEVRHPLLSGRYESSVKKKDEKKAIKGEFEAKYKQRLLFLQKASITRGKEYFSTGYDRLTGQRKFFMFLQKACGFSSSGTVALKDLSGPPGAKFVSQNSSMVTGTAQYNFAQFKDSPHVRYFKTFMYQGNWSGIPMFTPLRPHGEGLLVFFDGWGFAREDRVLYLEIIACRHLNPADLDTSDPFCDINCNGTNLQTSVKWMNLNPIYHEKFEIDVTNPQATLNISVYDKDYIGSDDFLGQITIKLEKYADGLEKREVFLLKGEHEDEDDEADYGEIELKLRWTNRKFEDDLARDILQKAKAIRIQAWARRIASIGTRQKVLNERLKLLEMVKARSIQITNTCRIRIARRKLNKLKRRMTACIKIQCRARIRASKNIYKYRLRRKRAAVKIQALMRKCLAKSVVKMMKKEAKLRLDIKAAAIQKCIRRKLVYLLVGRMKEDMRLAALANGEDDEGDFETAEVVRPPVSSWIKWYGVDPEYGLKRNRRMTHAYFDRMLKMQYLRLQSKYGIVYVDQYPADKSAEDAALERAGEKGLSNRDDFVSVFFPPFNPKTCHREDAVDLLQKATFSATIHVPTSIFFRQTVDFNVITIQCAVRMRQALKKKAFMIRLHASFSKLQRAFRRRNVRLQMAACRIQALFHLIHAKVVSTVARRERRGAQIIQSAYRCYVARGIAFDLRCVTEVSVLKFSSAVPFHGPAKVLDFKIRSFWMAESTEQSEIRVEMKRKECINQIWIMTSTHASSPKGVEISTVVDKSTKQFKVLVPKTNMLFLKGSRWHKFPIEETIAKYFKLTFHENYGDDAHIAVRQIRFVRTKEMSATIVNEPSHFILDKGPTVGKKQRITLRCEAIGWPHPSFQWFRNGVLIPNATSPELTLSLKCRLAKGRRIFRCLKCKMLSRNVPANAYHVQCGNCSAPFTFKDIQEYDKIIKQLHDEMTIHMEESGRLEEARGTMAAQANDKAKVLLKDILEKIKENNSQLQVNREARYSSKQDLAITNRFSDEGVYSCDVRNIRGGTVPILRHSIRAVVVVEHSVPFIIKVKPNYVPRLQGPRKKWTIYSSVLGTFKKGHLEGLVRLRYADGSFYEGPYISEEWIDANGHLNLQGRAKNHYGVFKCADGRLFEGINVDNHFDPSNLQTFYRLTLQNGEIYEGMFCDEYFHGAGTYTYKDGSVYEGQWFRGTRFGHGHLRSAEGWAYEGYFDTNSRHANGVITYKDGSMYMGQWYYDKRQGKGIYISPLRDVYRGEVVDGQFEGNGELFYADGSRHTGEFKGGKRNGIGIFSDADGTQYFGTFVNDLRHGEHVIKAMIPIEEEGQANLEIRVGIYNMGHFERWKIKYSNPVATKQFVALFKQDRSMFDSVYSMVLARNLPNIPEGVDGTDPDVQAILFRVRNEAGGLLGTEAIEQARRKVDALLMPLKAARQKVKEVQDQIDNTALDKLTLEKDASILMRKFSSLISMAEKENGRLEQFWMDEPQNLRRKFEIACQNLLTVEPGDFFSFRNFRLPPPFVKKILDAVSYLLGESLEWKKQQLLISDSVTCARDGDDLGLRFDFECKLAFLMKDYKVYQFARLQSDDLDKLLADPRMKRDSYYVESTGTAGPFIVDWVKTNYAYVNKAKTILKALEAIEEKKAQAFRFKSQSSKKVEEAAVKSQNIDVLKKTLHELELEILDLGEALANLTEMLKFLGNNAIFGTATSTLDYYQELEEKIEARRDLFVIETAAMYLVDEVESRLDFERKAKIRDALAKGTVFVEPPVEHPQIKDWLLDEVRREQQAVIDKGRSLGYSIEPEVNAISWEETQKLIDKLVWTVIAKMNDRMNDLADALEWSTGKGKKFNSRFLYVIAWRMWEFEGEEAKELKAVAAWEEIFVTPEECAKMALEAKVNIRMSAVAREQGKIWLKRHKKEIELAEQLLSEQFVYEFPDETGRMAMEISEDDTGAIPPPTKAACLAWIRLNPVEISEARDERNMELGDQFGKNYGEASGDLAFRIFNGLATEEEMVWFEYAGHWRTFHEVEYQAATEKVTTVMSDQFAEAFSVDTASEAARIIEGDAIGRMMRDEEAAAEHIFEPAVYFNAKCWGMRNVGLLRGATKVIKAQHASTAYKLWLELEAVTEKFRKGSYLLTPPDIRDSSAQDRFFGFRARLENKFAWLFGYLTKMHFEHFAELESLDINDPYGRVEHNIRPTKRDRIMQQTEEGFLRQKKQVEIALGEIINKLSSWNSYFGKREVVEKKTGPPDLAQP